MENGNRFSKIVTLVDQIAGDPAEKTRTKQNPAPIPMGSTTPSNRRELMIRSFASRFARAWRSSSTAPSSAPAPARKSISTMPKATKAGGDEGAAPVRKEERTMRSLDRWIEQRARGSPACRRASFARRARCDGCASVWRSCSNSASHSLPHNPPTTIGLAQARRAGRQEGRRRARGQEEGRRRRRTGRRRAQGQGRGARRGQEGRRRQAGPGRHAARV